MAPYRNPFYANVVVNQPPVMTNGDPSSGSAEVGADTSPTARARMILNHYGSGGVRRESSASLGSEILKALTSPQPRPRDDRLDRGEIGLDRASFDRVDLDGDGGLDAREIERGLAAVPDVELIVRLGRRDPWRAAIEVVGAPGHPRPAGVTVGKLGDEGAIIDLGTAVVEVRADDVTRSPALASQRTAYLAQFHTCDADRNGFVDRNEARTLAVIARVLDAADRDKDYRLGRRRADGLLRLPRGDLRPADHPPGDRPGELAARSARRLDRDRRIDIRELRALPGAIRREDRDLDGYVTPREIVRHYRWVVCRGEGTAIPAQPIAGSARVFVPTSRPLPHAPRWFLKMDRNRDGDLSPREFLGPADVFAAYDLDRDGLISPAEALQSPRSGARP